MEVPRPLHEDRQNHVLGPIREKGGAGAVRRPQALSNRTVETVSWTSPARHAGLDEME